MIPGHVVTDLCQLGRLGESGSPEGLAILKRLAPWGEVNRRHWRSWNSVTDGLDVAELANLVRGLLLTEESLRPWSSGSVSGVIWTYMALEKRNLDAAAAVAEWGSDKTTNSYVPFRRSAARTRGDFSTD